MLLDINNARISIEYEYDQVNTNNTVDDTSDDITEKSSKTYLINFGLHFNTVEKNIVNSQVDQEILASQGNVPSKQIYLSGNGLFSTLRLFEQQDSEGNQLLDELRGNQWLINEANLILYIDQNQYSSLNKSQFPDRLYLYKYDTGFPLTDFSIDNTVNNNESNRSKFIYGGILEMDEEDKPHHYKFRITDHVNRLIKNDSANVSLGLVPSSGINNIQPKRAETVDKEFINYPATAILNPKGVILHGSESVNHPEGGLKLEILYTEY